MSKLKIKTKERRFETARDLYGIFLKTLTVPETEDFIRKCFETEASKIPFYRRVIYNRRMASM